MGEVLLRGDSAAQAAASAVRGVALPSKGLRRRASLLVSISGPFAWVLEGLRPGLPPLPLAPGPCFINRGTHGPLTLPEDMTHR